MYRGLGAFELSCGPVEDTERCQTLGYEGAEQFGRGLPDVPVTSVELREGPDGRIVAWVCGPGPRASLRCLAADVE